MALAVLALASLAGCQVDTTVGIDARADGSGVVRVVVALDRAAAAQVPDLAQQLRVDDLEAAGWRVEEPVPREGGGVEIRARKAFRSPAGAARVVEELGGDGGPFRRFRLTRDRSFLRTRTALSGTVDLSSGLAAFSDPVLTERLGGSPLGVDPAVVERQLGVALSQVFAFKVAVRLPGEVESNAPAREGGGPVWLPELGQTLTLEADAEAWNASSLLFAAVAVVAGTALLAVLVRRSRRLSWG